MSVTYKAAIYNGDVVEQTYTEKDYEILAQRITDAVRKRRGRLPITIVITQS